MSINVTVSGNPVYIKKGKMVTACDVTKCEFEKRRLMRLEQVRHQSKNIAENVRNKIRKEKAKCMSGIEKEGEIKLKNWQARKLLELQNQYQDALDEIGVGHKQAEKAEEEKEILLEQQDSYDKIAKERGRAAAERLQIEKNEDNLKKALPIQRKKITRDGENTRSSTLANMRKVKGKSPLKKKKKRSQQTFDSDGENKVPQLFDLGEMDSLSSGSLEVTYGKDSSPSKISKEQQTSQSQFQVNTSDKAAQTLTHEELAISMSVPLDTRISDRIRRRARLNKHLDYCDLADKDLPLKTRCTCCQCPGRKEKSLSPKPSDPHLEDRFFSQHPSTTAGRSQPSFKPSEPQPPTEDGVLNQQLSIGGSQPASQPLQPINNTEIYQHPTEPEQLKDTLTTVYKSQRTSKEPTTKFQKSKDEIKTKSTTSDIPAKPKLTLKSSKDRISRISTAADPGRGKPVQYYDHPNRFSKQYIPKASVVEKIVEDNIEISPNLVSEGEVREKMRQRDLEAHVRGQVALEKERIQREYKELLKKLPALQKQERIYDIGADKAKYHMSRDRLEEMEKRRQNKLDNAYEEVFVRQKPALVTLSKRKTTEEVPTINLGSWDVDFEPCNNRSEQLNSLLMNLKAQKESLIKEIENTLSKDAINEINTNNKSSDSLLKKSKRKRSREERPPTPTSSDVLLDQDAESMTKISSKKGSSVISPSPRKKPKLKSKRKVLVLQNTSTQTTPKTTLSPTTSALTTSVPEDTTDKCVCPKDDGLCEIVIRIKDDETPEVMVNPPTMGKSVKVITEEKKVEESVVPEDSIKKDKSKESSKNESGRSKKSTPSTKKSLKSTTWRDSLSHTVSSQSTTSTSYMDPPKSARSKSVGKSPEFGEIWKNSILSDGSKILDPRLLTYIKKLLNMSRASVDELAVSATSEVSTPSESVVETPTNNPLLQLKNVMKYFNLDFAELQKQLSYHSNDNSSHYNTTDSVTVSATSSESGRSVHFKSCTEVDVGKKSEETTAKLMEYADIAASCTKKISSLTAMIEKVREEKKKMLESPPTSSSSSDKDVTTTSYLNLPNHKEEEEEEKSSSSASSHEDLGVNLLSIDYSYAEKLKQLTDEEIQKEKKRIEATDENILAKLKNMLQDGGDGELTISEKLTVTSSQSQDENKEKESPPLFLDIPKLPRLEASSLDQDHKKKRPPPSKGLRILGGPVVPHELSTIIEADSQVSTKLESPTKAVPSPSSGSSSVPDILTEVPPHKEAKSNSSDEVSEMETMETMLISIGMEWAIPTLKKTREALALSSSSSGSRKGSGEVSLREFLSKISSNSSSILSDSQGISLIQVDNRKTSTPILEQGKKEAQQVFLTDSDISSVREQSQDGSKTG